MTSLVAAFMQFGCVSANVIRITRENANNMVMLKRLGSECDSPKHISLIIINTLFSKGIQGLLVHLLYLYFVKQSSLS